MRPVRGDILDNFTPDQAAFVGALIATMPGAKLTVRRSRRRPLRTVRRYVSGMLFGLWPGPNNWRDAEVVREPLTHEAIMDCFLHVRPFTPDNWRSPAQVGRAHARWERSRHRQGRPLLVPIDLRSAVDDT